MTFVCPVCGEFVDYAGRKKEPRMEQIKFLTKVCVNHQMNFRFREYLNKNGVGKRTKSREQVADK